MKFTLTKHVHACFGAMSTSDIWLKRGFELPFYPYKGLIISWDNGEETINEVSWDLEKKKLFLYTESDKTFYDVKHPLKDYSETEEFKNHIKEYLDIGWEL